MPRSYSSLFLGFVVVTFALPASAQKARSTIATREKVAKKACLVGDYQKGVDILADLFIETSDPNQIFNAARCLQMANRWIESISRFNEYLRKAKGISDSERAETERHIADCEASLAKTGGQTVPIARAETPASEPVPPEVSTKPAPPPSDGSQGKGMRTGGIICAAVGLVAVATGVGLAFKTQGMASDAQKSGGATQAQEDQRKSLENWGWVSYGVGAAAIVTGAVLYIVGWPSDKSIKVTFLPALAPDGAALILQGRY
jgi:hypothetical protein